MIAASDEATSRAHGGRRRSVARLAAVQALYQLELNPDLSGEAVVREFGRHRLGREIDGEHYGEADEAMFADIVGGVVANRDELDAQISAALVDDWPLARLETVLRAVLRAAAYELAHRPDVPPRVTIREYGTIAHAFFTGKEPGLVIGVLDHLARNLRPADL